jgi:hypothetical protein
MEGRGRCQGREGEEEGGGVGGRMMRSATEVGMVGQEVTLPTSLIKSGQV